MFDQIKDNLTLEEEAGLSENISAKAPNDLSGNSILAWQKIVVVAIDHKDIFGAIKLLREIKKLASNFSNIPSQYQEVSSWLGYCAMPELYLEDIQLFFKNIDFMIILKHDFYNDLEARIKWRLSTIDIKDRDKWREQIYNAMHQNQNMLTNNFIVQAERPTIANWLKEYDKKIGTKMAESMGRANFESESSITAHLSAEEKALLKKLFDFYEFIKISSYDPAGFEEDVVIESEGKTYMNVNGEVVEIGDSNVIARKPVLGLTRQSRVNRNEHGIAASSSFAPSTELRRTPRNDNQTPSQDSIAQSANQILSQTNAELPVILGRLETSIESASALQCLGALLLLAQLRLLDNVLEDERFVRLIMDDLKRNAPEGSDQGVRINPTAPMYIARFLKLVLEDKLGLEHDKSIAFGRKLSRILSIESDKYMNIIKEGKWNI